MDLKERITAWVDAHQAEYFDDLSKLIAVDSAKDEALEGKPFGQGCADVLALGQDILKSHGFDSENDDNYVITADLNDKETELGILAHLDIVPTGDGWSYDPLTMRQDKEKVYGRGTDEECGSSDIRHYFAGHPVPPKTLSPDADYPVINIEKGGLHADASAEWAEEDVLPRIGWIDAGIKFNVVPAKAKALVLGLAAKDVKPYLANAEKKTRATFDVVDEAEGAVIYAQGVNAHASTPYEGVNALTALNTLLAALPLHGHGAELVRGLSRIFPHGDFYGVGAGVAQEDAVSGKLTITLDMLSMDEHSARAVADCRAALCANDQNLTDVMRAKYASIGFTMDDNKMYPPHYVSEDSPLVRTLLKVYEDYTGKPGHCIAIGGGTYVHSLEGGVSFGAAFEGTNNNMHGPDEFALKEHLLVTIKMYAQVICDLCK